MNKLLAPFSLGRPVLITYVPAGDPEFSRVILDAYLEGGADILEIGLPSGDPYMDGDTMGSSMKRAHAAGTDGNSIAKVLSEWLSTANRRPGLLWMCYADADFTDLEKWVEADVIDGVLMLGHHPEGFDQRLAALGVALTVFVPWEYTEADEKLARAATGYIMVPTRPGQTGTGTAAGDPSFLVEKMRAINKNVPVVAGFGVSDAPTATRIMKSGADGVVVGTACIEALFAHGNEGLRDNLQMISRALKASDKEANR